MGDAQKHNTRIFEHNVSDPSCRNNKVKRCRFVEVKNGLSLSQIVAFFPVRFCRLLAFWNKIVATFFAILEQCRLSSRTLGRPHCKYCLRKIRKKCAIVVILSTCNITKISKTHEWFILKNALAEKPFCFRLVTIVIASYN